MERNETKTGDFFEGIPVNIPAMDDEKFSLECADISCMMTESIVFNANYKMINIINKFRLFKIKLLTILFVGCLFGCQKPNKGNFPIIDLSKNHPKKEIQIQDIADIEIVPLETRDDVLLSRFSNPCYVSDKYIIMNDIQEGIYIFNRKGEIISYFDNRGQGPQEYTSNNKIIFDEKEEEIFVSDGPTRRLLVYSLSGKYKRSFKYTTDIMAPMLYNFDNETILLYNNDGWMSNSNNNYSKKPYILISKKDGIIVSEIDIQFPIRYSNRIAQKIDLGGGQEAFTPLSVFMPENNIYFCDDFVIADISSDTIFRLTRNRELIPMLVRTPSVHSSIPQKVWTTMLTTDKFIILYTTTLDFVSLYAGRDVPSSYLMYEFDTGQTFNVSFVNKFFEQKYFPLRSTPGEIAKNMFVDKMSPKTLIPYFEEKHSKGEQLKIPNEEDNPIVVIYKFK